MDKKSQYCQTIRGSVYFSNLDLLKKPNTRFSISFRFLRLKIERKLIVLLLLWLKVDKDTSDTSSQG